MSTNYIDQITDTAGTTHDISEGDSTRIFRATCSTAAATAAKVATLQTSNRNFSLTTGVRVAVTFTSGNSADTPTLRVDGSSTGTAKNIVIPDTTGAAQSPTAAICTWGPHETVLFTYDGTYWVMGPTGASVYKAHKTVATNTNQGIVKPWHAHTVSSTGPTSKLDNVEVTVNAITNTAGKYYAVEVDKEGRLFVNVPWTNVNSSYLTSAVTTITTTAGAHSTISNKSGAVSFNVPTKTSHLTNDSGFVTSSGVTSIGLANATNGGLSISGSPVTSSGTITVGLASAYGDTKNPYGSKTANYVLAAPNGSAGVPSFRKLVTADIPDLSGTYVPVTQTGNANSSLPSTTTITIDPKNTGDVIQCTSTQTTNFSALNFGPWGAGLSAGTPGDMGMNPIGTINVNTSNNLVNLGGYGTNGLGQIFIEDGGAIGLESWDSNLENSATININHSSGISINGDVTVNGDVGADQLNGNACNAAQINVSGTTATSIQTSGGITASKDISHGYTNISNTFNFTSSAATISDVTAYKAGQTVHLQFTLKTKSSFASGADISVDPNGTYPPILQIDGIGYNGARAIIARYYHGGTMNVRNVGATTIGSGNSIVLTMSYVTAVK